MRAIVGHTGFIGSNLIRQKKFDFFYNSKNIEEIRKKSFEEVYFSGLPGAKWKANAHPDEDAKIVLEMIDRLRTVTAKRFVHVSTIDVYSKHENIDEDTPMCDTHYAYGANRAIFEKFVTENYQNSLCIRLPIVFGDGFKKNYLFDLMNRNKLHSVFLKNRVQFYHVDDLVKDIEWFSERQISVANFATEPVTISEIVDKYFSGLKNNCTNDINYASDMKTKYTSSGYLRDKNEIFDRIKKFLE